MPIPTVTSLRNYVSKGGHLLYVIQEKTTRESLQTLLDDNDLQLQEADITNYAMLSDIDFSHPLFTPFASPQFRDFKTIHFWHHRQLELTTMKIKMQNQAFILDPPLAETRAYLYT